MKKILFASTLMLFYTGCDLFKDDGTLNIQTMKNINIYVDGEFKTDAGENTKLVLKEGIHKIKLYGVSTDGDWEYKAEEDVQVGGKVEKTITIYPTRFPSKKKIAEDERKEKELLAASTERGCQSTKDYLIAISLNKEFNELNATLSKIEDNKNKYFKENGIGMIPNDYIEFQDFSLDKQDKTFTVKIKNISNSELTYFWTKFYFINENSEIIGEMKKYQENISIKPGEAKSFKFPFTTWGDETTRKILMSNKLSLIAKPESINLKDNYGKIVIDLNKNDYNVDRMIKDIFTLNAEKQKAVRIEESIKVKCSNFK